MNSQEIFKNKYLKYKSKYLSVKKMMGGAFSVENPFQHIKSTQELSQAFISLETDIYTAFAAQLNYIIELSVDGNEEQQMWANFVLHQYNVLGAPVGIVAPGYLELIKSIFIRAANIRERLPPNRMSTSKLCLTDLRQYLYVKNSGLTREVIDSLPLDNIKALVLENWANVFSD